MSRAAILHLPAGPGPDPDLAARLAPEGARLTQLVAITARHRQGRGIGAEQRRALEAAQARVAEARAGGLWRAVLGGDGAADDDLAADALAASLYPHLWPSQAIRLSGLQPGGEMALSQALMHEMLMLSPAEELRMQQILSPAAPLPAGHWLQIDGAGPGRLIRPGARLLRRILGEDGFGTLPGGVVLADNGTGPLPLLLLAADTARHLDEITALAAFSLARQARERTAPGGPAVLLSGPPGTGKTLAARHLSRRLGRPLFRLNLGAILSKWMGETERNLTEIFGQMSGTRGCILIDECDALLSRRTAVREARDHSANLTVSHLLMLLEAHQGPVFATTNLRGNIDDAFLRRFGAVVEFRRPDRALRQTAWLRALSGVAGAEALARLAAAIDLSAAEIANAGTYALALAEAAGRRPEAAHLARAIRRECTKSTATFTRDQLGPLAEHLPEDAP